MGREGRREGGRKENTFIRIIGKGKSAYSGTILKYPSDCWVEKKILFCHGKMF